MHCREAGCTPFAASLLADYFDEGWRASAMGVYNWGIYVGFSLTYAIGNFVTDANLFGQVSDYSQYCIIIGASSKLIDRFL